MSSGLNSHVNVSENGVDIYLYIDYSFSEIKDWPSTICLGRVKYSDEHWDDRKFAYWIVDTFDKIVKSTCSVLSSSDNHMSVAICGHERYVMMELTNDMNMLEKCISIKKFAFGGGEVCPCSIPSQRGYNPYKEIYYSIINDRKVCSERKAVGIFITQCNIPERDRKEALNAIKLSSKNNIDIITIGVRKKKINYKVSIEKKQPETLSNTTLQLYR